MKKISLILVGCYGALLSVGCSGDGGGSTNEIVHTDPNCSRIVSFSDANFKAKVVAGGFGTGVTLAGSTVLDTNGDGEIQVCEAENIASLTLDQSDISSVEGILEFRNLQTLSLKYNNINAPLDLSSLKRLVYVMLTGNHIPSLKVTGLNSLEYLTCDDNNLQTLSVNSLGALKTLYCSSNQITSLNIEGADKLEVLRIDHNSIAILEVSHLSNLKQLYTNDNLLTNLDVSDHALLQDINCSTNNLQSLDLRNCPNLFDVVCDQNRLTQLMLSGCTNLTNLRCSLNSLTSLDFSGLAGLSTADCSGNRFVSLDIRDCTVMNYFDLSFNPNLQSLIVKNGSVAPQGIDIYQCPSLVNICCDAAEQAEITSDVTSMGYNCTVVTNCF